MWAGRTCVCGHPRSAHVHHRRGTDCTTCGCARFRGDDVAFAVWAIVAMCVAVFVGPEWSAIPAFLAGFGFASFAPVLAPKLLERDVVGPCEVVTVHNPPYGYMTYATRPNGTVMGSIQSEDEREARRQHNELAAFLSDVTMRAADSARGATDD